jgi:RTA1 like protein
MAFRSHGQCKTPADFLPEKDRFNTMAPGNANTHGLSCVFVTAFLNVFFILVFGSNSALLTPIFEVPTFSCECACSITSIISIISAPSYGIGTLCVPHFRVAWYTEGREGFLLRVEWLIYVFDAIFMAGYLLLVVPPCPAVQSCRFQD